MTPPIVILPTRNPEGQHGTTRSSVTCRITYGMLTGSELCPYSVLPYNGGSVWTGFSPARRVTIC